MRPNENPFGNATPEEIIKHMSDTMRDAREEGLFAKRQREWAEEMKQKQAARAARDAQTTVRPAPRTAYSRDPKVCKHQFANGRKVCPYCATTNPAS